MNRCAFSARHSFRSASVISRRRRLALALWRVGMSAWGMTTTPLPDPPPQGGREAGCSRRAIRPGLLPSLRSSHARRSTTRAQTLWPRIVSPLAGETAELGRAERALAKPEGGIPVVRSLTPLPDPPPQGGRETLGLVALQPHARALRGEPAPPESNATLTTTAPGPATAGRGGGSRSGSASGRRRRRRREGPACRISAWRCGRSPSPRRSPAPCPGRGRHGG